MGDNNYQIGDMVHTPTMGEGEVVGVYDDLCWVAVHMVDGVKRPTTYKAEILERGTFVKDG